MMPKLSLLVIVVLLTACISTQKYTKLDAVSHPAYVHYMELTLADDVNSDDSATAVWAHDFMAEFEKSYRAYKPSLKFIKKLSRLKDSIEIKVIGGNWCSDTRRELPRLCKVLAYMGVPTQKLHYYKVDRKKHAINDDFAAHYNFTYVPVIVLYKSGKEMGKIEEVCKKSTEEDLWKLLR
jgi:hypothetical protein